MFNGTLVVLDLLLLLSAPIMLAKAAISLVHLIVASINVARIDIKERSDIKNK